MTTNYISIKSILYDLSLTVDERYWNENKMLEWLHHGLRQINFESSLEPKVKLEDVYQHKATMPSDFKYLIQIAEYIGGCDSCNSDAESLDLPENSTWTISSLPKDHIKWKVMRLTSNPYHNSICLDKKLMTCTDCSNEFGISPSGVITTTLQSGTIMIAYLGYPTDKDGDQLIPDDESLKEALLHYVLYRYWMSKYQMKEEGSDSKMQFHLKMWSTLSKKAKGNLNMPDINQIENIKNNWNRLVPVENRFQQMFLTLGNRENVNF